MAKPVCKNHQLKKFQDAVVFKQPYSSMTPELFKFLSSDDASTFQKRRSANQPIGATIRAFANKKIWHFSYLKKTVLRRCPYFWPVHESLPCTEAVSQVLRQQHQADKAGARTVVNTLLEQQVKSISVYLELLDAAIDEMGTLSCVGNAAQEKKSNPQGSGVLVGWACMGERRWNRRAVTMPVHRIPRANVLHDSLPSHPVRVGGRAERRNLLRYLPNICIGNSRKTELVTYYWIHSYSIVHRTDLGTYSWPCKEREVVNEDFEAALAP
ncbi:hypothetical protein Anapl_11131 [Anas platyrhynchos]|uniref:Uncharacterized protein n=1 Tax=Anas platyrhynchos TaxID=8839 RepID=R0JET7_ANAPL|nr:hypothetical protein Anapl_11131 [Anas platyrhynchos]